MSMSSALDRTDYTAVSDAYCKMLNHRIVKRTDVIIDKTTDDCSTSIHIFSILL